VAALLREVVASDDQHAARLVAERLGDEPLVQSQDLVVVPGADADELLQRLDVAIRQRPRDVLDRLAPEVGLQQTAQVAQRPAALLGAPEEVREPLVVLTQAAGDRRVRRRDLTASQNRASTAASLASGGPDAFATKPVAFAGASTIAFFT